MHVQAVSAPMDSSPDLLDVDMGVNVICYASLDSQPRHDGCPIRNVSIPQPKNQLAGDVRLKYLDPIARVAKRHIPIFLNRPQGLLFSIYSTNGTFLMPCSLLHLENRNREKEER